MVALRTGHRSDAIESYLRKNVQLKVKVSQSLDVSYNSNQLHKSNETERDIRKKSLLPVDIEIHRSCMQG